jgi:hypothetical protein
VPIILPNKTPLDDPSEQLRSNVELLVRVLRKELVLLKQVPQHAGKDVLKIRQYCNSVCFFQAISSNFFSLIWRVLEFLKHLQCLVNGQSRVGWMIVNSLEVTIGLFLHLFGEQVGIFRKYDGITYGEHDETKKILLND